MLGKAFFDKVRSDVFHANGLHMDQTAVDCMNAIDFQCALSGLPQYQHAYVYATAFHEARFEWYIREVGRGRGKAYGNPDPETGYIYYGRGLSQLTHKANYAKYGIADKPDTALERNMSVRVLVDGMRFGVFTSKKLSDFISLQNNMREMYKEMRTIVNGHDKADLIAGYALAFNMALSFNLAPASASKERLPTATAPVVAKSEPAKAPTTESSLMEKMFMIPSLAAALIHSAVDYGPKVGGIITGGIANSDDIRKKALDMVTRLKSFDLPGAVVDFNAILSDLNLSQDDLTRLVHTARTSAPVNTQ